ncbi:MAG TPA: DUF4037 domain-containing protein [Pyrinomonadaceae bacterium]
MNSSKTSEEPELLQRYFGLSQTVASAYKRIPNVEGITVGGSLARGLSDESSDVEMYVYYRDELPGKHAIRETLDNLRATLTRSADLHWFHPAWGHHTFFEIEGTKFELGYRNVEEIRARMERFLSCGSILSKHGIHDVPFGHYESGVASCIQESIVLYDPDGQVRSLKSLVKVYPERLKRAILNYYLQDARVITEQKIIYAALRDDTYQFNACVAKVIRSVVLCLFAINEVYFPGDKWNQHYISSFRIKPGNYEAVLSELFSLPDLPARNKEKKKRLLTKVIRELEQLAKPILDAHGDPGGGESGAPEAR